MDEVHDLLDRLERRDPSSYADVDRLINQDSEQLPVLLLTALRRPGDAFTAIQDIVVFMPRDVLAEGVDVALATVAAGADPSYSQAGDFLERVALQQVDLLHPHLRTLWDLGADGFGRPWRGTPDDAEIERLTTLAEHDGDERDRAVRALIETRRPDALAQAVALLSEDDAAQLNTRLGMVGYGVDEAGLRALTVQPTRHIVFSDEYLGWSSANRRHPTKELDTSNGIPARFGGLAQGSCPLCQGPLHRLLTLPGTDGLPNADLVTCLTCLGWSSDVIHVAHAPDGSGQIAQAIAERTNDFMVAEPFPETTVSLVPTPERWQVQNWGLARGENLHRVGGEATWVQDPDHPACLGCGRLMTFLVQLDDLYLPGLDWMWGMGGICYMFWCDPCRRSAALWQCT